MITSDVLRAAWYATPDGRSRLIEAIEVSPIRLVVRDAATRLRYRVPVTVRGGEFTFGEPEDAADE
jgi:hypothetical protein